MRPTACQEQGAGGYTEGAGTLKNCLLFVHTMHRELLVNGETGYIFRIHNVYSV